MTDAECAETLAEFRLLTLGPRLSEALDHAIGRLRMPGPMDGLAFAGLEAEQSARMRLIGDARLMNGIAA